MEIDSDIPQFLATQKRQVPAALQNYYNTFEDLYERKYAREHGDIKDLDNVFVLASWAASFNIRQPLQLVFG